MKARQRLVNRLATLQLGARAFSSLVASAATFTVTKTTDTNDGACDVGAFEYGGLFIDGPESGDSSAWLSTLPWRRGAQTAGRHR